MSEKFSSDSSMSWMDLREIELLMEDLSMDLRKKVEDRMQK
jgi:hypothetical protein